MPTNDLSRRECAERLESLIGRCQAAIRFNNCPGGCASLKLDIVTALVECKNWSRTATSSIEGLRSLDFARYEDVGVRFGGTLRVVGGKLVRFNTVELPIKESLVAVLPTLRRTLEEVNAAGRMRGPKPRNHKAVVAVVRTYEPKWKSHLKEICEALDALHIDPPRRKGTGVTRWSWSEFLNEPDGRSGVKKSLDESLRKFPK